MNSRIIQTKNIIKKINKRAKVSESDKDRKKSSELINITILRLLREFYQNLYACRAVFEDLTYKNIKEMLKTINAVIWKRCKTNCDTFTLEKVEGSFDKTQVCTAQNCKE